MDFSIISTHSHDCTKIIYIIQILAKYSKALSMNHIRSTQHIDEKKNKIKLHHKTESENLHCNPNRKLVHAKHHKNHNNNN